MQPTPRTNVTTAQALDERYGLLRRDQLLRDIARRLTLPGNIGARARDRYANRVTNLTRMLREHGFFPPPATISDGILQVGDADTIPFRLRPDEILRHLLVAGPSGSGKTTMLRGLALQLRALDVHVITLDYKQDMRRDAALDEDYLILHPDAPFNILETDGNLQEHIATVLRYLAGALYGGEGLTQAGHESLTLAYEQHLVPSVVDWHNITKTLVNKTNTYQRTERIEGLLHRQARYIARRPGNARTRTGIPHRVLAHKSIYIPGPFNDTTEFFGALTIHLVHDASVQAQERDKLQRVVFLDEGLLTFGEANRINGPVLLPLIPQFREHGTGLVISAAHLGGIHETVRANTYTTALLPQANGTDTFHATKTLGLTREQADTLPQLQPGEAIIRTGKCEYPFRITFPAVDRDKHVTDEEWSEGLERTNRLATNHTTTPAAIRQATTTNTTKTPPPDHSAPTNNQGTPSNTDGIALTTTEEALLRFVATNGGISTVSEAYDGIKAPYAVGDAAKRKLLQLGLLTATPIIARSGRGGRAIALQPTTAGYERIRTTPPRRSRGGAAQAEYFIQKIHKLLPGSSIEVTLG